MPYDAGQLAQKVVRRRRLMRSRLISFGITVIVLVIFYLWQRDQLGGAAFMVIYGLVLVVSFAWFAVFLIGYLRARQELASVGSGTAVRIGPPGVEVAGLGGSWTEVGSLSAVKGGLGRSPLQLALIDGRQAAYRSSRSGLSATLAAPPGHSGGRFGVDLSALDT